MQNLRKRIASLCGYAMNGLLLMGVLVSLHLHANAQEMSIDDIPFTRSEQIISSTNRAQMMTIMEAEGYSVELARPRRGLDAEEDLTLRLLVWRIDGYRATIIVSQDGSSLMFHSAVRSSRVDCDDVNRWNSDARYSRSYLDGDGDPVIEMDLKLTGGVTLERVQSFLRTCHRSFREWSRSVL